LIPPSRRRWTDSLASIAATVKCLPTSRSQSRKLNDPIQSKLFRIVARFGPEWQRDWALKDTYDAVMDIVKTHFGAYGVGVEYADSPEQPAARMAAKTACHGHRISIQLIPCQTRKN